MPQTHAVFGELAHYGSQEPENRTCLCILRSSTLHVVTSVLDRIS